MNRRCYNSITALCDYESGTTVKSLTTNLWHRSQSNNTVRTPRDCDPCNLGVLLNCALYCNWCCNGKFFGITTKVRRSVQYAIALSLFWNCVECTAAPIFGFTDLQALKNYYLDFGYYVYLEGQYFYEFWFATYVAACSRTGKLILRIFMRFLKSLLVSPSYPRFLTFGWFFNLLENYQRMCRRFVKTFLWNRVQGQIFPNRNLTSIVISRRSANTVYNWTKNLLSTILRTSNLVPYLMKKNYKMSLLTELRYCQLFHFSIYSVGK